MSWFSKLFRTFSLSPLSQIFREPEAYKQYSAEAQQIKSRKAEAKREMRRMKRRKTDA